MVQVAEHPSTGDVLLSSQRSVSVMKPSPQRAPEEDKGCTEEVELWDEEATEAMEEELTVSVIQVLLHPSPFIWFPSSHCSPADCVILLSPQRGS